MTAMVNMTTTAAIVTKAPRWMNARWFGIWIAQHAMWIAWRDHIGSVSVHFHSMTLRTPVST